MNESASVRDYAPLARRIARQFFAVGADREDVEQEAMIGLLAAIRCYDPQAETPFGSFAALVIRRHVVTFVVTAQRDKHKPLSESVRELPDPAGFGTLGVEALADARIETLLEDRERLRNVFAEMEQLTPLERRCLVGFACGLSYGELGAQTGDSYKTIDNALLRARRKVRAAA